MECFDVLVLKHVAYWKKNSYKYSCVGPMFDLLISACCFVSVWYELALVLWLSCDIGQPPYCHGGVYSD